MAKQIPSQVAQQAGDALAARPVDVAFVGIGENGHLAFNDPPADFSTEHPYLIVTLDDACRRQQVGEGWFASIDDVPARAISMSVRQILKSKEIIAVVPDARKANAVKACVEGPVSPMAPASILQTHANTTLYLDRDSAALLGTRRRGISMTREVRQDCNRRNLVVSSSRLRVFVVMSSSVMVFESSLRKSSPAPRACSPSSDMAG